MNELSYIHYTGNAEQLKGQLVSEGIAAEVELVLFDAWDGQGYLVTNPEEIPEETEL